jgi:hypothetical protein
MTSESRQFLRYLADQPKQRVGFWNYEWTRAQEIAAESLQTGYVRLRPLHPKPYGYQLLAAGKAYLAGEALDA